MKETKAMKKMRFAKNMCSVFAVASACGASFSFANVFAYGADKVMAFLLLLFCATLYILLEVMKSEFEVRYEVLRLKNEKEMAYEAE